MIATVLDSMVQGWYDSAFVGLMAFALRATALLLVAWFATRLLHRASAAIRHLIWTAAIVGVLALPVLALVIPAWTVSVMTVNARFDTPLDGVGSATTAATSAIVAPRETPPGPVRPGSPSIGNEEFIPSVVVSGTRFQANPRNVFGVIWLTFAILLLARLAIANARVSSWRRSSRPVEDGRWRSLLTRLTRQYGIERPVVLLDSAEADVPVTWGVVYPVVLLPESAAGWDDERRVAVLTHELAHVKRFDALTQQLAQVALALLWFHPLIWMAVRRMRMEREHACDDFVLAAGARASRYADDLLGFARNLTRPAAPAAAALAMARRSELEGRLLAILDPAVKRTSVRRARVVWLSVTVVVLSVPLAAFRPGVRIATASVASVTAENPQQGSTVERSSPSPSVSASRSASSSASAASSLGAGEFRSSFDSLLRTTSDLTALLRAGYVPELARIPTDTEPQRPVAVETLVEVTKAATRMTSDAEKGQLLTLIAQRYQRSDELRHAYLDAVSSMTSDHERAQALIGLLDRNSLPSAATAHVLKSASMMTSDLNRGQVLKRISAATFADTIVQRAYLFVVASMTSDMERAGALSALLKQRGLSRASQTAILRSASIMTSGNEKANVLLLFLETQSIADESIRRAFFRAAESMTSDAEYRRVMAAVMR